MEKFLVAWPPGALAYGNPDEVQHSAKAIFFIVGLVFSSPANAQSDRRISISAGLQANATVYDQFKSNNKAGIGINLKTFVKLSHRIDALFEVTGDVYGGTKVALIDDDGNFIDDGKDGAIVGIQGGVSYRITNGFRATLTTGVCILDGDSHFAFRPGAIFIPGQSKRVRFNLSFTNVSQNVSGYKTDFGYLSFGIGFRII